MEIQTIKSEEWLSHTNHKYWIFLKEYRTLFSSLSTQQHNTKSSSYPTINFKLPTFIYLLFSFFLTFKKLTTYKLHMFQFHNIFAFLLHPLSLCCNEMVMITIMLNNMIIAFSFIRILILEVRSCGVDPSILRAWWDAW